MIPDRDIWAAAQLMVKRYGADAAFEAAKRAEGLVLEGDVEGAASWMTIVRAIEKLQATAPPPGSKPN